MIAIALSILSRIWPYLLGAALLGIGYYKADHWCNAACVAQTERADDNEAVIASLKASITAANQQAEVERVRIEGISRSAAASAGVQLAAAQVRADNAEQESSRILAADHARLRSIVVPDSVRDAYYGGVRLTPATGANPGALPAQGGATPADPLYLDQYAGVCTSNKVTQDKTADDYDALYEYTTKLWNACNTQRKESP